MRTLLALGAALLALVAAPACVPCGSEGECCDTNGTVLPGVPSELCHQASNASISEPSK